jgi:hypothetical protein
MPERLAAGSASADARFRFAIDWRTSARRRNPKLEDAVLDLAYDKLIDLLLARPDLGGSRSAVFALGNKQLGWRISSTVRGRYLPDGRRRPGPAGATSLEGLRELSERGGWRHVEPVADDNVEMTAIRRITFKELLSDATHEGRTTATIVVGYALGFGPDELEAQTGIKANTITQRKGRFTRAHREEIV